MKDPEKGEKKLKCQRKVDGGKCARQDRDKRRAFASTPLSEPVCPTIPPSDNKA